MAFLDRAANRGSISTGYDIENSCRFDNWYNYTQVNNETDTGDDWMHRSTSHNAGFRSDVSTKDSDDGQRWVMSFWCKRGGRWCGNPFQRKGSYGHQSSADRNRSAIMGGWMSARSSWIGFDSVSGNEDAFVLSMKQADNSVDFITNAQYRDHAAWYHFFIKLDTTQATSTDRLQLWVNGVRVTSWDAYPTITQNSTQMHFWADGVRHNIGRHHYSTGTVPFHGYLADFYYLCNDTTGSGDASVVDTAQYTATTFGEFNSDGIWVPIEADVIYGDQAYFLEFKDSADLGKDSGSVGNHFDSYSMGAVNQCTDTPTNNFCVMQPAQNAANGAQPRTLWGGLRITDGASSSQSSHATMGVTTGKWYYEHYMEDDYNTPQNHGAGWLGTKQDLEGNGSGFTRLTTRIHYGDHVARVVNGWADSGTGAASNNNTGTGDNFSGSNAAENDVMGTAVDLDAGKVWWHIRGTWHTPDSNVGDPAAGTYPGFSNIATVLDGTQHLVPAQNMYTSGPPVRLMNFGNPPTSVFTAIGTHADDNGYGSFAYEPPSGFLALCSKNIGESGLSNIVDDPSKHFQNVIYDGTGSSNAITNDGNSGLQPDLLWIKRRDYDNGHQLLDSSRGVDKILGPEGDAAETTLAGRLSSFDSDGFTVTSTSGAYNASGEPFVAWQWKMNGGTTTTNNDGNRSVTLQANATAGQSIMLYEGSGADGATYGHGLGAKPHMVIIKNRDSSNYSWMVWHHRISPTSQMTMDGSGAKSAAGGGTYQTFTSSVIALESASAVNVAQSFVAYAFTGIEGYSKFDIFEGNDPSNYETDDNGTFVYCGFKPAFVMYKPVDNTGSWLMFDNKRNKIASGVGANYNGNTIWSRLAADLPDEETAATENFIDFLSNGFQIKLDSDTLCNTYNEDGELYIFAAFAAQPFITSKGVPCTAV